jgi:hypothetical protein
MKTCYNHCTCIMKSCEEIITTCKEALSEFRNDSNSVKSYFRTELNRARETLKDTQKCHYKYCLDNGTADPKTVLIYDAVHSWDTEE